MPAKKPELIVALDVDNLEDAERLVKSLRPAVELFKVGSQLYTAFGPKAVQMIGHLGGRVFLDLKFHDIPNTVRNAVITGSSLSCVLASMNPGVRREIRDVLQYPVFMITVHVIGGEEMMRYAAEAAREKADELKKERPKIVGVTVLTSDASSCDVQETVVARAISAKKAGLDGVVCSVEETSAVRSACGKDFVIVTPGIRPQGTETGDQKRVATPRAAKDAGSDFIVVGRPIVKADDPALAARKILQELS